MKLVHVYEPETPRLPPWQAALVILALSIACWALVIAIVLALRRLG